MHWVSLCEDRQKGTQIRILADHDFPIHGAEYNDGVAHGSIHNHVEVQRTTKEHDDESTLSAVKNNPLENFLITTGKGKVPAGIFSRQHLLVSSIEANTAFPMMQDDKRRNARVAILEPNARGNRYGMTAYEQPTRVWFGSVSDLNSMNKANKRKRLQDRHRTNIHPCAFCIKRTANSLPQKERKSPTS